MGPVTQEDTPAWTRDGLRRRRFVTEVEPEVEDQSEESAEDQSDDSGDPKPDLDVLA
jgi:hypothetical protein